MRTDVLVVKIVIQVSRAVPLTKVVQLQRYIMMRVICGVLKEVAKDYLRADDGGTIVVIDILVIQEQQDFSTNHETGIYQENF